jgi:hypothetical protein
MKIDNNGQKCTVTIKRKGNSPVSVSFSMADAEAQGLAGKDNWRRMPAIMLQWRAVAAACRLVFPDVIGGLYTPEELGAFVDEQGEVIEGKAEDVTEQKVNTDVKPEVTQANTSAPVSSQVATDPSTGDWSSELINECMKRFGITKPNVLNTLAYFVEYHNAPMKEILKLMDYYKHYRGQNLEPKEAAQEAKVEYGNQDKKPE